MMMATFLNIHHLLLLTPVIWPLPLLTTTYATRLATPSGSTLRVEGSDSEGKESTCYPRLQTLLESDPMVKGSHFL